MSVIIHFSFSRVSGTCALALALALILALTHARAFFLFIRYPSISHLSLHPVPLLSCPLSRSVSLFLLRRLPPCTVLSHSLRGGLLRHRGSRRDWISTTHNRGPRLHLFLHPPFAPSCHVWQWTAWQRGMRDSRERGDRGHWDASCAQKLGTNAPLLILFVHLVGPAVRPDVSPRRAYSASCVRSNTATLVLPSCSTPHTCNGVVHPSFRSPLSWGLSHYCQSRHRLSLRLALWPRF